MASHWTAFKYSPSFDYSRPAGFFSRWDLEEKDAGWANLAASCLCRCKWLDPSCLWIPGLFKFLTDSSQMHLVGPAPRWGPFHSHTVLTQLCCPFKSREQTHAESRPWDLPVVRRPSLHAPNTGGPDSTLGRELDPTCHHQRKTNKKKDAT